MNAAKNIKIPKIDCHFNDLDSTKIETLKNAIQSKSLYYKEFGEIEFCSNNYNIEYDSLVKVLPDFKSKFQKAFIFIDPYEYKHIKAIQIKNLISNGNSEVLMWLPTQFMYRFATNGTPEVLKDFIEDLDIINEKEDYTNVWKFINKIKNGFQTYLGKNLFVDTFSIQKDINTVFCLFFFCSHIKGFEKMLEAKWEIDTEQGKGWSYSGNQPTLFHDQKTNELEDKLKVFLEDKNRSNGEVYEFTLRQGFLPKHTNEILYNWQKKDKIKVLTWQGENARKKSFYIAYNYFKNDPQKVNFKLI